ncbi:ATP-grasp domain-containing protein [Ruminiclostridium cellulolyticum]|uniref:ATP-grasp domain-containing protein n=1 Tax=Ruminiclostridium cellulolyticum (strain ATCC 35319 / DSM 5812 / JCM 6584 / H10) TaxID=394503 RepID=B8I0Z0_RUMCH|nr:ATP-grasp domain-containing protein [Ruminiclostridium cellulolyticum]ACL77546.1 hypothetical protein Ccel_3257 [Ruminiclostridium cellulolyticum H10]
MSIIKDSGNQKILIYNSGIEHEWEDKKTGVRKVNNLKEQKILNRQAELLFFISNAEDTVYVVKESDPEFLKDMEVFGISKPKTVVIPDLDLPISKIIVENEDILQDLKTRFAGQKVLYVPYILSSHDEKISEYCNFAIYGSSSDLITKLNNKANARRIVEEIGLSCIEGGICSSKEELEEQYNKLKGKGYMRFVLKEPYNSAGKGVFFIKDEKQFYSFLKMMRFNNENKNFEVIIEGWIDDKRDINYQIEISKEGEVKLIAITEQIISVTAYKGSLYPPKLTKQQEDYYNDCAQKLGTKLYQMGFSGIIGIDSIIDKDGTIFPAIEFNARFNQSTFYIPFLNYFRNHSKRILIRSYDVKTNNSLNYVRLKEILRENKLLYCNESKKGIIILNSSCLSIDKDSDGQYDNRIYLANVYDKNDKDDSRYEEMDNLIKVIN